MNDTLLAADFCLKCNICSAACPVSTVTDRFPGPKTVGPQALRYRNPRLATPDRSVEWCSGCGVCSRVCPHGVPVAEANILAKARVSARRRARWRDAVLSRPALIGRFGAWSPRLANWLLHGPLARPGSRLAGLGGPDSLPRIAASPFHRSHPASPTPAVRPQQATNQVAYFFGCSSDYFEPPVAEAAVFVLEKLGLQVLFPRSLCCGLPLQSNGFLDAARAYASSVERGLSSFVEHGIPILATSTSCSLALKHEYGAVLGLKDERFLQLAQGTWDIFEFLLDRFVDRLARAQLNPQRRGVLYHAPCQLGSHAVGMPAVEVLRRIPGLDVRVSASECCGVAGTYGLKRERHAVARQVGESLFRQVRLEAVELVATDSETCRWWIRAHTQVRTVHPIQILAASLGGPDALA